MKIFSLFLICILFLAFYLVRKSMQTVPFQSVWLVSRLGTFHRTLESGQHFIIPYLDEVTHRHSLATQQILMDKTEVTTAGQILVAFNATLHLRVTDPYKASYNYVGDPFPAMMILAQETLKMEIANQDYSALAQQIEAIAARTVDQLNNTSNSKQWGVTCVKCQLHIPPQLQARGAKTLAIPPKAEFDAQWKNDLLLAQASRIPTPEEDEEAPPFKQQQINRF